MPLVLTPYLIRVAGPTQYGSYAYFQSLSGYLGIIIAFGFELSATREVAGTAGNHARLREVVSGTLGAKGLLSAVALAIACLLYPLVARTSEARLLYVFSVAAAFMQANTHTWYFQGIERLRPYAAVELSARVLAAALVVLVVRRPEQLWMAPAAFAATSVVAYVYGLTAMHRAGTLMRPRFRGALTMLRDSSRIFVYKGAIGIYTSGSSFLFGQFAPLAAVGYYAAAEKVVRTIIALIGSISQSVYPVLTRLHLTDRRSAARVFRAGALSILVFSTAAAFVTYFSADWVMAIIQGSDAAPGGSVLRMLSPLILIVGISTIVVIQWLLPRKMDNVANSVVMLGALVALALTPILVPRFAESGMALTLVIAELSMCLMLVGYVLFRRTRTRMPAQDRK